jgi:hypothetical protein
MVEGQVEPKVEHLEEARRVGRRKAGRQRLLAPERDALGAIGAAPIRVGSAGAARIDGRRISRALAAARLAARRVACLRVGRATSIEFDVPVRWPWVGRGAGEVVRGAQLDACAERADAGAPSTTMTRSDGRPARTAVWAVGCGRDVRLDGRLHHHRASEPLVYGLSLLDATQPEHSDRDVGVALVVAPELERRPLRRREREALQRPLAFVRHAHRGALAAKFEGRDRVTQRDQLHGDEHLRLGGGPVRRRWRKSHRQQRSPRVGVARGSVTPRRACRRWLCLRRRGRRWRRRRSGARSTASALKSWRVPPPATSPRWGAHEQACAVRHVCAGRERPAALMAVHRAPLDRSGSRHSDSTRASGSRWSACRRCLHQLGDQASDQNPSDRAQWQRSRVWLAAVPAPTHALKPTRTTPTRSSSVLISTPEIVTASSLRTRRSHNSSSSHNRRRQLSGRVHQPRCPINHYYAAMLGRGRGCGLRVWHERTPTQ